MPTPTKKPRLTPGLTKAFLCSRLLTARFTELPAYELHELHSAGSRDLAHGLLVVVDVGLLREHVLGVKIAHAAFNHLLDDVVWLAFFAGLLGENGALFFD